MTSKLFNSKWPIVEAAMNMASNKNLALAVSEAGGFPSLATIPAFTHVPRLPNSSLPSKAIDFDPMYFEITDFIKSNGSADVIVPMSAAWLLDTSFLKLVKDVKISHWEIFPRWQDDQICSSELIMDDLIYQGVKYVKKYSKVLGRILAPVIDHPRIDIFDGIEVKGSDSAGGRGFKSCQETFDQQIKHSKIVIPYGGIGTPRQVKEYIQKGAPAVGVGTLFALCEESPLNFDVKMEMINQGISNITVVKGGENTNLEQNAILLNSNIKTDGSDNKGNHTDDLLTGMYGDGNHGLVFAGHGIKHVTAIRTVRETMEYLTSEL